jgi:2C-methyl-D-erythritol 2,4-cyclodiphosphate synthase
MIHQIRRKLNDFLRGANSLEEFENWFLPATWNLNSETDASAHELAAAITLALAEYDGGDLNLPELKVRLKEISSRDEFQPLLRKLRARSVGV